jgi:hypothetical protein
MQSVKRAVEVWAVNGAGLGDEGFNGRGTQWGETTPEGEIRRKA